MTALWRRVLHGLAELGQQPPGQEPAAEPEAAAEPDPAPAPTEAARWDTASSEVRKTAAWLASATGAVGAAVFGAGPLVDDTDVGSWDTTRWVLVLTCAVVGVLGVVAVVGRLVTAMLPVEHTLDSLPRDLVGRIEREPASYLPGDARTVADFQDRLRAYSRAAAALTAQARAETGPEQQAELLRQAQVQTENRDVYRRARTELLDLAKYRSEAARLGGARTATWFAVAAVAAVVGATGFTFLTHDAEDADGGTPPQLADLAVRPGLDAEDLWSRLGVEDCLVDGSDSLPVLFLGSEDGDPVRHEVQTLGRAVGCDASRFTIGDDVATVVVPEPEELTVVPPSPAPGSDD